MKVLRTLAAAVVLTCIAGTAQAQERQDVNGWTIYPNDDNCRAIVSFQNGTMVSIAIYTKNSRSTMMILNKTIFAAAESNKPFDGKLAFVKGDDLVTDWMELPVLGVQLDDGTKGVYIGTNSDGLLKSFGTADVAGILRGSDAVVSFKIGEDGPAVEKALRQCIAGK